MSYEVTRFEKYFQSFGGNHGHDRTQHATQPSIQRSSQWWISSTIDLPPRQPPQCPCDIFYCSAPTEQIQREVLNKVNKTPPHLFHRRRWSGDGDQKIIHQPCRRRQVSIIPSPRLFHQMWPSQQLQKPPTSGIHFLPC